MRIKYRNIVRDDNNIMSEVQKIPKIHFGSKSNQTHHSKNPKRSQISRF